MAMLFSGQLHAQAKYTATGPGTYIQLGVAASGFQADYGQHHVYGGSVFLDANLSRRVGLEAEVRRLSVHTDEDVRESTYLIGPRISTNRRNFRPYVKVLAGRGQFTFPYHYAQGSYLVIAPGAGLDWRLPRTRISIRVLDFEYQMWPQFSYGAIHPYGISSGISVRVF